MPRYPWPASLVLVGLLVSACGSAAPEPSEPITSSATPSPSPAAAPQAPGEFAAEDPSESEPAAPAPNDEPRQPFPLAVGGPVPVPSYDTPELSITPETPAASPEPGIPDPMRRTPLERAALMDPPPGVAAETSTDTSTELPHWGAQDTEERGWVGPAFTYAFMLDTPGMRVDGSDEEFDRNLYASFNVLYVGDVSDIRDGISLSAHDDPTFQQSVIDVAGYPAVLTVPADGEAGLHRIEMALHGELIVADNDVIELEGKVYGMNAEELTDMTEQYLETLYGEDL